MLSCRRWLLVGFALLLVVAVGVFLRRRSEVHNELVDDLAHRFIAETRLKSELRSSHSATLRGDQALPDERIRVVNEDGRQRQSIDVVHVFANAAHNPSLQEKLRVCVSSMLARTTSPIRYHLIGDAVSRAIALRIIAESRPGSASVETREYPIETVSHRLSTLFDSRLFDLFRYKPGAYYGDTLFFLSIVMHHLLPESVQRIVILDVDLRFNADVRELNDLFDRFDGEQLIGLAAEQQPVYRHVYRTFRAANPTTRVGEPGFGFNSGVVLEDLRKMRASVLYETILRNATLVSEMAARYSFHGHLGDQDFFTLIGGDFPALFFTLPCEWNRQLCTWWREHGYAEVFDAYFRCAKPARIAHGSCNTPITE